MEFSMNEAKIPDFEDMIELAKDIRNASLEKTRLELKIEDGIAKTVQTVTSNPEYYKNGKPPSMSFVNSTYVFGGLDGKLYDYRVELGTVTAELEFLKNKLAVYRDMIDIWRTLSANQRASVL